MAVYEPVALVRCIDALPPLTARADLALPQQVEDSRCGIIFITTMRHGRYVVFQLAEFAVPRAFRWHPGRIDYRSPKASSRSRHAHWKR
jgi:hypothetical protein